MKKKWSITILILFFFLIVYEMFNNSLSIFLITISIFSFLIKNNFSDKYERFFLFLGFLTFFFVLVLNRFFILLLLILFLLFINKNEQFISLISTIFSKKRKEKVDNEFIIVNFRNKKAIPGKIEKNKWLSIDSNSSDSIYSWQDFNFTKLFGNSTFDLGNTLLPKGQNIILIRQGAGKIKVLIPEETAVSLDFSALIGNITLDSTEYSLLNENFKWHSDNYYSQDRKIKISVNLLIGELELVFL